MPGQEDSDEFEALRDRLYREEVPVAPDGPNSAKIRVFTIEGVRGSGETARAWGTLTDVNLRDPERTRFDALSYQWGDTNTTRPVLCNGMLEVGVTVNAFEAIAHLYQLAQRGGKLPLTIWIDQICINQKDDEEKYGENGGLGRTVKYGQLDLMAEIFSLAETTYLWLGLGTLETDKAMSYLARGWLPPRSGLGSFGGGLALVWRMHLFHFRGVERGLADLVGRDWIHRLWTLQECILARRPVVICGDKTVPWLAFVYATQFYDVVRNGLILTQQPPAGWNHWLDLVNIWLDSREPTTLVEERALSAPLQTCSDGEGLRESKRGQVIADDLDRFRTRAGREWKASEIILLSVMFFFVFSTTLFLIFVPLIPHFFRTVHSLILLGLLALWFLILFLFFIRAFCLSSSERKGSLIPVTFDDPIATPEESVVHEVLQRNCKELKDKWFGVKAFITDKEGSGPAHHKSISDIYHHLSIKMLQKTEILDLLLVGSYVRSKNCPSWVIDWSQGIDDAGADPARLDTSNISAPLRGRLPDDNVHGIPTTSSLSRRSRMWFNLRYYLKRRDVSGFIRVVSAGNLAMTGRFDGPIRGNLVAYERFNGATRGSKPWWNRKKLEQDRELEVRGCVVAQITEVDKGFQHLKDGGNSQEDLETTMLAFRSVAEGLEASQLDICIKYLLLVTGDRGYHISADAGPLPGQIRWREILERRDLYISEAVERLKAATPFIYVSKWTTPLDVHKRLSRFIHSTQTALVRCSGASYSGLGVSCPDAKVGDEVCLISGVSLPMVLRHCSNGYQIVGPAFIGNLMDGRVWENVGPTTLIQLR